MFTFSGLFTLPVRFSHDEGCEQWLSSRQTPFLVLFTGIIIAARMITCRQIVKHDNATVAERERGPGMVEYERKLEPSISRPWHA